MLRNNKIMSNMRTILKNLMESEGHNSYDVFRKTGVQPSTISKYMSGAQQDLRPSTVVKLAALYGITESQLRGDVPIDGMEIKVPHPSLKEILPLDEYEFVTKVKTMDREARGVLYRLADMLIAQPQAAYNAAPIIDRRGDEIHPNPQRRLGESRNKAAPIKSRKNQAHDARSYYVKSSRIA